MNNKERLALADRVQQIIQNRQPQYHSNKEREKIEKELSREKFWSAECAEDFHHEKYLAKIQGLASYSRVLCHLRHCEEFKDTQTQVESLKRTLISLDRFAGQWNMMRPRHFAVTSSKGCSLHGELMKHNKNPTFFWIWNAQFWSCFWILLKLILIWAGEIEMWLTFSDRLRIVLRILWKKLLKIFLSWSRGLRITY